MDELWNSPKTLDDFANDRKYGIRDTLVKENLNGFLFHLSDCKRGGVLSAFDETYRNENVYRDTEIPCINALKMYETDPNLYADDNASEYELPELIVCYKEINCHVKDICIDEIRYTEDKMMIESCKSASEISFGKDTSKECRPSDLTQTGEGEANCGATGQVETDVSEEGCFVNRTLPVQDFGTWRCLRSFLHDVPTLPDQIPSGNAISNSPAAIIVETEPNKGIQCMNSKESLETSIENVSAQSFNHKDINHEDLSPNGHVQYASSEDRSIKNANEQALEAQNVHNHEHGNSVSFPFISQVQCDVGESSFSAADVTTYSGPIAHSRSLSVQSDSSTTSTQSFTFPVLQSEWKSSPILKAFNLFIGFFKG
ncbi:unnamed protein product [Fraxinus pennsylvanica]|uniref:Uncharacterized protein n=1 Tax=Fraxinus pennsylvanica TaxID=56036 RepID=A0AAD1ZDY6_9LAMI|nr:unnamed protein product [Fraxinus pennsylvanica]